MRTPCLQQLFSIDFGDSTLGDGLSYILTKFPVERLIDKVCKEFETRTQDGNICVTTDLVVRLIMELTEAKYVWSPDICGMPLSVTNYI